MSIDHVVRLIAAVFEDGSAEGPRPEVDRVEYSRLGRILEAARLKDALDSLRNRGTEGNTAEGLIGPLPATPSEALRSLASTTFYGISVSQIAGATTAQLGAFNGGVRTARELALRGLSGIEKTPGPGVDRDLAFAKLVDRMAASNAKELEAYRDYALRTEGRLR
jgi:hypothetical protein